MGRRPAACRVGRHREVAVQSPDPAEQRQSPRVEFEVRLEAYRGDQLWAGLTENISEGGLFIATGIDMSPGEEFEVALTLPDGEVWRAAVVVRWVRPVGVGLEPGIGVQFKDLDAAHGAKLQRLLKANIGESVFMDLD
jgi:uncharacterized protein (TIGR02266 family)